MIDVKLIRDDAEGVKQRLATRSVDGALVDQVFSLDEGWRALNALLERNQSFLNNASKEMGKWIGALKRDANAPTPSGVFDIVHELIEYHKEPLLESQGSFTIVEDEIHDAAKSPDDLKRYIGEVSMFVSEQREHVQRKRDELDELLMHLPNLPGPNTPVGKTEEDNVVRKEWGKKPEFDFEPKPHWDLVADKGLELEIGGRISGSGFPFLRGKLARLERAMINFFLELHTREHGYTECWTPFMVRAETLRNSGQLPKFYDDLYRADERDDLYLIPTAEVPLTSVHAGELISDDNAPIRYCAYTPCFRREAGAAGKDTRGILRVHQFSKVELMVVTTPERSEEEHETLTRCAETVLEKLNIPYRRLELCTADLGFGAARCYDLEAWAPGVGKWLEVSSCSNFTDFQARRAKIRVRDKDKNTRLAHTLNGSGLACPRTMIAIIENNQRADGSIAIPEALQPYYGASEL